MTSIETVQGYLYGWRFMKIGYNTQCEGDNRIYLQGLLGGILLDRVSNPAVCWGYRHYVAERLGIKRPPPPEHVNSIKDTGVPAPHPDCTCGYYTLKEPNERAVVIWRSTVWVWVYVRCWGRVSEYTLGWRVEQYSVEGIVLPIHFPVGLYGVVKDSVSNTEEEVVFLNKGSYHVGVSYNHIIHCLLQYNVPFLGKKALEELPTGIYKERVGVVEYSVDPKVFRLADGL